MIIGIENLDKHMRKAVLAFIAENYNMDESIKIEEEDDNIIIINSDRYFIITGLDSDDLLDEYNNDLFSNEFSNLTSKQLDYVNKEEWIDDNGLDNFKDYLEKVLDELPSDPDYVNGYYFYNL